MFLSLACSPLTPFFFIVQSHRIDAIITAMNETPETTEAMDALETYVTWADGRLVDIAQEIADSRQVCDALHSAQAVLESEAVELFWRLGHSPVTLKEELEEVRIRLLNFQMKSRHRHKI